MIEIVSATRLSEADFWEKSALGQSLRRMNFESRISCAIAYENTAGLPELYNSIINEESGAEIILFIHDDVWIDDFFLTERVIEAAQKYDVFGVVGNKKCKHLQPSWAFLDTHGTWDKKENFSGAIAHGSNPFGAISYFGPAPESCKILDGVFIGINKKRVRAAKVFFDKQFNFHFYDVDFCQEAIKKDLKIGTWPIALTHQSTGGYDEKWRENYFHYHEKWKLSNVDENQNSELENNEFIKDNRQTPAHNLINHELMEMIPADTTHIIDVGCRHGQMARIYKEINKNIIYTGIEIIKIMQIRR